MTENAFLASFGLVRRGRAVWRRFFFAYIQLKNTLFFTVQVVLGVDVIQEGGGGFLGVFGGFRGGGGLGYFRVF